MPWRSGPRGHGDDGAVGQHDHDVLVRGGDLFEQGDLLGGHVEGFAIEALDSKHPAHDYFADRERRSVTNALNINWSVPDGANVEHVLQAGLSMMDGIQLRWLRSPGRDLNAMWVDCEDVLFPSPYGTDTADPSVNRASRTSPPPPRHQSPSSRTITPSIPHARHAADPKGRGACRPSRRRPRHPYRARRRETVKLAATAAQSIAPVDLTGGDVPRVELHGGDAEVDGAAARGGRRDAVPGVARARTDVTGCAVSNIRTAVTERTISVERTTRRINGRDLTLRPALPMRAASPFATHHSPP